MVVGAIGREVLKENRVVLVTDPHGDVVAGNSDGQGLYFNDTRFLSVCELQVQDTRPMLLSSAGEHNFMSTLQLANEPMPVGGGRIAAARTISIRRNRFVQDGLHERIGFFNYNRHPAHVQVQLTLGSDFRDMFEVRGYARPERRGQVLPPEARDDTIRLRYVGVDGLERQTVIAFEPAPSALRVLSTTTETLPTRELPGISGRGDPRQETPVRPPTIAALFDLDLPPGEPRSITVRIQPQVPDAIIPVSKHADLEAAFVAIRDSYRAWEDASTVIETDNHVINEVIHQSLHDLRLLTDRLPTGLVPSAGIPWFCAPFGRDSLVTSIQTLMLNPQIALGTLAFLAQHQGARVDDWRDEEPGKILHEVRLGELAALGQVPHTPYYGSIDATPLFLVALGEYLDWTNDWEFARRMEPNVVAALDWVDRYGDLDGDGLVEYQSRSSQGIPNHGWKDSPDGVCHRDGRAAQPPVALVEVQGYVYDARLRMARLFDRLGQPDRAGRQRQQAAELQRRFDDAFWMEDEQFYALALDGEKRPVAAVSSNPGHCLWSGIVPPERTAAVVRRLTAADMLSGWGIRTLAWNEPVYNPMSYHNGSVWPHDTAICAAGMKRRGAHQQAVGVLTELLEAAVRMPLRRLPELYCGFGRDRHYYSMPAQYPTSCSPQAWAAGSLFHALQTLLGLDPRPTERTLVLRPLLPPVLNRVSVRNLRIAGRRLEFEVRRDRADRVQVDVRQDGGLRVVVEDPADSFSPGCLD